MDNIRLNEKTYSTVLFGKYEYSDGGLISRNIIHIKYPIEWMILDVDNKNKKMLLFAKNIVELNSFANCPIINRGYSTSWEKSYLRYWLNSDFINIAFTAQERSLICTTHISPEKHLQKKTLDRIFLLNEKEYGQFFTEHSAKTYWMYVFKEALNTVGIDVERRRSWWLRTVSEEDDSKVKVVDPNGNVSYRDSNEDEIGIRPAMWVKF